MHLSTTVEPRQPTEPASIHHGPGAGESPRLRFWIALLAIWAAGWTGARAACDTNVATVLDLSNWSVIQYGPFLQPPASWILSDTNTVVTQNVNADGSIFLSPVSLQNAQIQGSWMVNTNDDDDFIGFVFGYQDSQHFYLFDWKQLNQANQPMWGFAEQGMSVKAITADSPLTAGDFAATFPVDTNRVRSLYHNTIQWVDFTSYDFNLEFRPGHINITVSQGAFVLDSISIDDHTFTNGSFGFYNFSQGAVRYSGFTGRGLSERPVVSVPDPAVLEGDTGSTSLVFSVNLSRTNCETIRINYAITPGSATAGVDYTAAMTGTLIFAPGYTNLSVNVTVLGDRLNEANETVILSLSDPVSGILGDAQAIGTIIDDDPIPFMRIDDVSVREGDLGNTPMVFRVSLSSPSGQLIQAGFATANLTATAGSDYIAMSNGVVTFPAGQTNGSITVMVRGDIFTEPDETFRVCLTNALHASLERTCAVGTIRDDDTNADLSITKTASPGPLNLGDFVEYTITVRNLGPAQATGIVVTDRLPVGLDNIEFISGQFDCTIQEETITCTAGSLNPPTQAGAGQVGTITILADVAVQGTLLNSVSLTGSPFDPVSTNNSATATVTVVNVLPSVNLVRPLADPCLALPTNLVLLANAFDTDGTVETVEFYDRTNKLGESQVAPFELTWSNVPAGPHQLSAVARDDSGGRATSGPVSLFAAFPAAISIDDRIVTEGNLGPGVLFSIRLDSPSCRTVSVQVLTADLTAMAGTDYTPLSPLLTFLPGETLKTVAIPILNDDVVEPPEAFLICLTNAVDAVFSKACGMGTILDDDANQPPTVVIIAPTNGASFSAPPGLIPIEAAAQDPDGTVQSVEFYGDGMWVGTRTNPPFRLTWTNNFLGTYRLIAVATDNDGARGTSAPVSILIRTCNPVLNASPLVNQTRCLCDEVTFTSTISSSEPARFTWKFNGTVLAGQTNQTLLLQNLKADQAGTYAVEIATACASLTRSATLTLQGGGNQNPVLFTNASRIIMNDHAVASPYPSPIQVNCVPGLIQHLSVTLDGISHNFPDDIDILLVSPAGRMIKLISDAGGNGSFKLTNVVLSFADTAMEALPDATRLSSGTYAPSDYAPADSFPAPAPALMLATNFTPFLGTDPNGTWSLFVVDDLGGDAGFIARGWSLALGWDEAPPTLTGPVILPDGRFQMTLNALPRMAHVIETSTNLLQWSPVSTNTPGSSPMLFVDPRSGGDACRFYRAVRCP